MVKASPAQLFRQFLICAFQRYEKIIDMRIPEKTVKRRGGMGNGISFIIGHAFVPTVSCRWGDDAKPGRIFGE